MDENQDKKRDQFKLTRQDQLFCEVFLVLILLYLHVANDTVLYSSFPTAITASSGFIICQILPAFSDCVENRDAGLDTVIIWMPSGKPNCAPDWSALGVANRLCNV